MCTCMSKHARVHTVISMPLGTHWVRKVRVHEIGRGMNISTDGQTPRILSSYRSNIIETFEYDEYTVDSLDLYSNGSSIRMV